MTSNSPLCEIGPGPELGPVGSSTGRAMRSHEPRVARRRQSPVVHPAYFRFIQVSTPRKRAHLGEAMDSRTSISSRAPAAGDTSARAGTTFATARAFRARALTFFTLSLFPDHASAWCACSWGAPLFPTGPRTPQAGASQAPHRAVPNLRRCTLRREWAIESYAPPPDAGLAPLGGPGVGPASCPRSLSFFGVRGLFFGRDDASMGRFRAPGTHRPAKVIMDAPG